jgi:hypothetical protein
LAKTIFISYRRDDSEGEAGRLYDDLVRAFGNDSVFMDVAGIQPGADFRKAIEDNVSACGVFLAIVGPAWATITNPAGRRRLDDPNDFVALEIGSALKRGVPVIPVLVHEARMPSPDTLPETLHDFSYRNSVELSHARWNSDVHLLIEALKPYVTADAATNQNPVHATIPAQLPAPQPTPAADPGKSRLRLILAFSGVVSLLLIAAILYFAGVFIPSLDPSTITGNWIDSQPRPGNNIYRVQIAGADTSYSMEAWGDCTPNPCDWGSQPLAVRGQSASSTYNMSGQGFTRQAVVTVQKIGANLSVTVDNTYTTPAGTQTNQFNRIFLPSQQ